MTELEKAAVAFLVMTAAESQLPAHRARCVKEAAELLSGAPAPRRSRRA